MTHLRYYIPLIIECNKHDIKCLMYYMKGNKKSPTDKQCPLTSMNELINYSKIYNFSLENLKIFSINTNFVITMEGRGLNNIPTKSSNINYKIISLCYCTDYTVLYSDYADKIDYCIFLNNLLVEELFKFSLTQNFSLKNKFELSYNAFKKYKNTHLFFGSPKYDISLNKEIILKKYNLSNSNNYIFVFLPRLHELNVNNLIQIFNYFVIKNYYFLLKTRNKDDYSKSLLDSFSKNILYINDTCWYPHPSLELIHISNFVINFDSTGLIEAIMLEKNIINFNTKKNPPVILNKFLNKIWKNYYCINSYKELDNVYNLLISHIHNNQSIIDIKNKYFFNFNSSKKILEFIKNIN